MNDLYLKFADETQSIETLYTEVVVDYDEEGNPKSFTMKPNFANIDVIGTIYRPTGEVETVDGMEVPVMAALEGYHVNVRAVDGEDTSALTSFAVVPSVPMRVWG